MECWARHLTVELTFIEVFLWFFWLIFIAVDLNGPGILRDLTNIDQNVWIPISMYWIRYYLQTAVHVPSRDSLIISLPFSPRISERAIMQLQKPFFSIN